jgi:hypothetical protein
VLVAGLALVGLGGAIALAPHLPDLGRGAGAAAVACALPLALATVAVLGLERLAARPPRRAAALAGAAAIPAVAFVAADVESVATPAKLALAAGLGFLLAGLLEAAWQLAVIAALALVVDVVSVLAGPSAALVQHAPRALDAVALHLPLWGQDRHVLVGPADAIFFGAFVAAAAALGLRRRATAAALAAALEITVVIAVAVGRALPALPFMALALLAVNAGRWRGPARAATSDAAAGAKPRK